MPTMIQILYHMDSHILHPRKIQSLLQFYEEKKNSTIYNSIIPLNYNLLNAYPVGHFSPTVLDNIINTSLYVTSQDRFSTRPLN